MSTRTKFAMDELIVQTHPMRSRALSSTAPTVASNATMGRASLRRTSVMVRWIVLMDPMRQIAG